MHGSMRQGCPPKSTPMSGFHIFCSGKLLAYFHNTYQSNNPVFVYWYHLWHRCSGLYKGMKMYIKKMN